MATFRELSGIKEPPLSADQRAREIERLKTERAAPEPHADSGTIARRAKEILQRREQGLPRAVEEQAPLLSDDHIAPQSESLGRPEPWPDPPQQPEHRPALTGYPRDLSDEDDLVMSLEKAIVGLTRAYEAAKRIKAAEERRKAMIAALK